MFHLPGPDGICASPPKSGQWPWMAVPPAGFEEGGLITFAIILGSSISTRTSQLSYRNLGSGPIRLLLRDQGPQNACVLIGDCDASSCRSRSLLFVVDPAAATVDLGLGSINHRPGSMHQQRAQIGIAALADTSSVVLPPLECCRGTRPSHAANCLPFRKA